MNTEASLYRFSLHRPRESHRDFEVSYKGRTISYRANGISSEWGVARLAKMLRDEGNPDGKVIVTEIHTKAPLVQEMESLYRLADVIDAPEKLQPVVQAEATVTVDEPKAEVAEEARRGRKAQVVDPVSVAILRFAGRVITLQQRAAVRLAMENPTAWTTLHPKTRRTVADQGWVKDAEAPELTDDGRALLRHMGLGA